MFHQFFGKPFFFFFLLHVIIFLASIVSYQSSLSLFILIFVGLLIFFLSFHRLEWGIYAFFFELFSNSHGHLITTELFGMSVSVRMVLFVAVLAAWIILFCFKRVQLRILDKRFAIFMPLVVAVIIGTIVGWSHQPLRDVMIDGNAYWYLALLLPIFSVEWDVLKQRTLLQLLAASAVWMIVLSLGILYVFTHFYAWTLQNVYAYFRDVRLAEITFIGGGLYRVFIQSQFFVIVFGFLIGSMLAAVKLKHSERMLGILLIGSVISVVLMSLSRSFWFGIVCTLFFFATAHLFSWLKSTHFRESVRRFFMAFAHMTASSTIALVILLAVIFFPYPLKFADQNALKDSFKDRSTQFSDAAASSRWKLLDPMIAVVRESPIFGSGFGKTVTFETDDPRIREMDPTGTRTTFAMEWGWLELWIKMGILGPISFLFLFLFFLRSIYCDLFNQKPWLAVGFMSSIVFLVTTHIFSPYLNHPIGLGLLLFILPFLDSREQGIAVRIPTILPKAITAKIPEPSGVQMSVKEKNTDNLLSVGKAMLKAEKNI